MQDAQRLRSIAASDKPNETLEESLRLRQRNRREFDGLPITERLRAGHYLQAKDAHRQLAEMEKRHGNQ